MALAGWYRDPSGQGDARYWDGQQWTDSVSVGGQTGSAPMDPARLTVPPAPGTEYTSPAPRPAGGQNVTVQSSGGGPSAGAVLAGIAVLVAVVALVIALTRDGDSTDDEPTTETPATEQPADTEAPSEEEAPADE